MAIKTRALIILAVLILAACSSSPDQVNLTPILTESEPTPKAADTTTPLPPPPTRFPTFTPLPPTDTVDPTQPLPTSNITISGEPFPLLPPGYDISLKYVELITTDMGWGISTGPDGIGHILRTDDGGYEWREITPPQPLTPNSFILQPVVHFHDPEYGWASYSGTDLVWTTHDGGRTWQPFRLEFTAEPRGGLIHSLDRDQVWFFQFMGAGMMKVNTTVYHSANGGRTWTKLLDPYTDIVIQAFDKTGVEFFNAQYGWLTRDFWGITTYISLEITEDGGVAWESLNMPPPPSESDLIESCMCALFDPRLFSELVGSLRMTCHCGGFETPLIKSYLYSTYDGGENWEIEYIPEGDLHYISPRIFYVVGPEIYRSEDIGVNWDFVKTVYWDGQLSFVGETALGIAHCTDDDESALVKTINGCETFELIKPKLLSSYTER